MISGTTILRIIYFLVFFLSGLIFPWWLTLLIGLLGFFLFSFYVEALFLGLFFDALYGGVGPSFFFGISFFYSLIFFVVFILCEIFKNKIRKS
jgi:hypothetical protein